MEDFYFNPNPKKKRGPKSLPVYQFDIDGNFIYRHANAETACENLLIAEGALRSCMQRKNCYRHKWYFSPTKDFKVPVKKWNHNPLYSRNQAYVPLDATYEEEED